MGQGDQRVAGVEIPLKAAVVGLKGPKGQQDATVDAIGGFNPAKGAVVFFGHRPAPVDAVLRYQVAGKLDKGFLEHPLRPIRPQNLGVLAGAFEKAVDGCPVISRSQGFLLE